MPWLSNKLLISVSVPDRNNFQQKRALFGASVFCCPDVGGNHGIPYVRKSVARVLLHKISIGAVMNFMTRQSHLVDLTWLFRSLQRFAFYFRHVVQIKRETL